MFNTDVIDWLSIKLTGISVTLAFISGNQLVLWFSTVSIATTIIYNLIRIIKEIKNKK